MDDGIPANTNPFVVLISWTNGDVKLHEIAPEYFGYNEETEMPVAREVLKSALTQKEAEALVRKLLKKGGRTEFAVHEQFAHIIPNDLKKAVRVVKPYSTSHGKNSFYIPCCTDDESYYLK